MKAVRKNDYRFVSERALDAFRTYEVGSISLVAATTRARAGTCSLTNTATTEEVSK
jgi:hypothetical protein